jgi:RNA polymerase sigma factor (TIGR02999 family)
VSTRGEVTHLLAEINAGNREAESQLIPLVYNELRRLARHYMQSERSGHTLQATAVVHEVYLRLVRQHHLQLKSKAHFLALAASLMRRILCDYARSQGRAKRGGDYRRVTLDGDWILTEENFEQVVDVDRALTRLEVFDQRQGKIVELLFFGGLTVEETAAALDISPKTVKRDWSVARAWLHRELRQAGSR